MVYACWFCKFRRNRWKGKTLLHKKKEKKKNRNAPPNSFFCVSEKMLAIALNMIHKHNCDFTFDTLKMHIERLTSQCTALFFFFLVCPKNVSGILSQKCMNTAIIQRKCTKYDRNEYESDRMKSTEQNENNNLIQHNTAFQYYVKLIEQESNRWM